MRPRLSGRLFKRRAATHCQTDGTQTAVRRLGSRTISPEIHLAYSHSSMHDCVTDGPTSSSELTQLEAVHDHALPLFGVPNEFSAQVASGSGLHDSSAELGSSRTRVGASQVSNPGDV